MRVPLSVLSATDEGPAVTVLELALGAANWCWWCWFCELLLLATAPMLALRVTGIVSVAAEDEEGCCCCCWCWCCGACAASWFEGMREKGAGTSPAWESISCACCACEVDCAACSCCSCTCRDCSVAAWEVLVLGSALLVLDDAEAWLLSRT